MAALAPWAAAAESDLFCDLFAAGSGMMREGTSCRRRCQAWGHSLFIDFDFLNNSALGTFGRDYLMPN